MQQKNRSTAKFHHACIWFIWLFKKKSVPLDILTPYDGVEYTPDGFLLQF